MRRTALVLSIALIVGSATLPAQAEPQFTPMQGARAAANDYLVPLARPDTKAVTVRVLYCRDRGAWHGCRVHVFGATTCNAILRVKIRGQEYAAWMPRVRCR